MKIGICSPIISFSAPLGPVSLKSGVSFKKLRGSIEEVFLGTGQPLRDKLRFEYKAWVYCLGNGSFQLTHETRSGPGCGPVTVQGPP